MRTPEEDDFRAAYPVALSELVTTPMIFRDFSPYFQSLAYPNLRIIQELAASSGYSSGAVRTAVSRARARQVFTEELDARGVRRFRIGRMGKDIYQAMEGRKNRPPGFTIAVSGFNTEHEKERRRVREILSWFGFHPFARNAWINGWMETAGVEAELAEAGLEDHCYTFRSGDPPGAAVVRRLRLGFGLDARIEELRRYGGDLERFLSEGGLSPKAFFLRFLYAGPVHYRLCFIREPPLPAEVFPAEYPLTEVESLLDKHGSIRKRELVQHWRELTE